MSTKDGSLHCEATGWEKWTCKICWWCGYCSAWTCSLTQEQFTEPGFLGLGGRPGKMAEEGGFQKKDRSSYSSGANINLHLKILQEPAGSLCLHPGIYAVREILPRTDSAVMRGAHSWKVCREKEGWWLFGYSCFVLSVKQVNQVEGRGVLIGVFSVILPLPLL